MRLKSIAFNQFKRFTDTRIQGIPDTARLIVLAGPNGSGKSSIFDGLKTWHWTHGSPTNAWDESYGAKVGSKSISWHEHVKIEFHEPVPSGPEDGKKLVYVRTAFRNEPDFNIHSFNRLDSPLDRPRVMRTIDTDASVSDNYQRLVLATIEGVYRDDVPDSITKGELRDRFIGRVRDVMRDVSQI